ncbi:MAG: PASTA domain-containing protein [Adlercreutzia mucosicola]|nr:PASTA domain-containing protein [Adlercreutzia mucosicola]
MKCPHCSFDNTDDAAFCEKCGHVFLSSDRIPEVPDPAEMERRRDAALTAVPPILKVPDVVPPAPAARPSVADVLEPLPEPASEPDFSGFERLVDSSYVPPVADAHAGDTAEIPVIRDEYVPQARNYTMGLSERELRRREREQRRMAKKFEKQQAKEEKRAAKQAAKAAAAAAREEARAAKAAEREDYSEDEATLAAGAAAAATEAAVAEAVVHEDDGERVVEAPGAAALLERTGTLSEEEVRSWRRELSGGAASLNAEELNSVLLTGDGVVGLFERAGRRGKGRAKAAETAEAARTAALELPTAERGLAVLGERGIESATADGTPAPDADAADGAGLVLGGAAGMAVREAAGTSELPVVRDKAEAAPADEVAEDAGRHSPRKQAAGSVPATDETAPHEASDGAAAASKTAKSAKKEKAPKPPKAPKTARAPKFHAPRSKKPFIIATAVVVAVLLGGVGVAAGTYAAEMWGGKTIPEVVGLTKDEAIAKLGEKGFVAEVTEVKSDEAAGTVLSASPNGGTRADEGSTIALEVATPRVIPAVAGLSQQEAADALTAEGFTAVEMTQQKSNEAAGTVLAVSPEAGTQALSGDTVTLTVAVPFTVPDVAGLGRDDAVAALEAEGYSVNAQRYYTEDVAEGTAVGTDPEAGTELNSGSEVTLLIAKSRANELVELTKSILPDAILKTDEASYKVESVESVSYRGDNEVSYKVVARQFEVVDLPFGLGQKTYYDKETSVVEGGIVWDDNNKVSYANPAITY